MAQREGVDEFRGVDSRSGIGGEVPDVVCAGPARVQAHTLDAAKDLGGVLRLNQTDLEVGARRDLDVAGGQI